jgi:membrane AbrB-like protein
MSFSRAKSIVRLRRFAETMLAAIVGGTLLGLAGLPAGWMSGAIVAVAGLGLFGRTMYFPDPFARALFVLIGITLGGAVTPETLKTMSAWPLSLLALAISMALVTISAASYLRFVHGWDGVSALLGAAPGALSQSLLLAADCRVDVRRIATVQTVRLFALIVALPAAFGFAGISGSPPVRAVTESLPEYLTHLSVLIAVCAIAGWLAQRFRLPGGLMVGSMIASGVLHGADVISVTLPWPVITASLVMTGALIGARLGTVDRAQLVRLSIAGFGTLVVATSVACLLAVGVATLLSLRVADVVIAYAPGGMEAMTILAFILHLDPAYVGVHQLARFLFVALTMPFAVGAIRAYEGKRGKGGG